MPYFANINGVCGTDLYIGEQNGIIYYYINDVTAPVITSVMEDQVIDAGDDCEAAFRITSYNVCYTKLLR